MDRSDDRAARLYGERVAAQLPPAAILVDFSMPDEWQYKAVFGYYFRTVLGARPDVLAITKPPLDKLALLVKSPRPVYLYAPNPRVEEHFDLRAEGDLYRVTLKKAVR